jgi:nucleotide-binding universal stress UspA family protein
MAINLAKINSANLTALYVVPPDMRYGYTGHGIMPGFPGPLKEVLDIAVEKGKKYLDQVQKIASDKNINIQTEIIVAEGSVPKEVIEYAEGQKIDLIVVGTRGMTGIKKMLLGSTASDIVTYAHCPVLVVK